DHVAGRQVGVAVPDAQRLQSGGTSQRGADIALAVGAREDDDGRSHEPVSSRRTIAAPSASALSLAKAVSRGIYFMPQSGAGMSRSGGMCSSARRMRAATISGVSGC